MIERINAFVSRLESLAGTGAKAGQAPDRRALAALRRIAATWPTIPAEGMRIVAPFLPDKATPVQDSVYYLVAAFFGMHPSSRPLTGEWGQSFGSALLAAASKDKAQGPERRLLAILACHAEDLPEHLRHAVSYLRSKEVPIDYRQLMFDLERWDSLEGPVQRRWGRDFWSGLKPAETEESAISTPAPKEESSHVR